MRVFSLFVSILFSDFAFSQNNFHNQLKSLVNDSAKCFTSFRGDFKQLKESDSIYHSSFIFDGTAENNLFVTPTACVYISKIEESVKKRRARRIADEWRDKINSVIGNIFALTAVKKTSSNSLVYGWDFEYERLSITVGINNPDPQFTDYFVGLYVVYKKQSPVRSQD